MAELLNRISLESTFARRLAKLSARHRREVVALLGNPPNAANVPAEVWTRIRREIEEEAAAMMAMIFLESADQHGFSGDAAIIAAEGYGAQQAETFATRFVETTQSRLQETSNRWRRQIEEADDAGEEPTISRQQVTDDTTRIFGPDRAANAATNETTRARHQGGEIGTAMAFGLSDDDTWFTSGRQTVCDICSPLHNTRRPVWAAKFPGGPPDPHNLCQCYIVYANAPKPPGTWRTRDPGAR